MNLETQMLIAEMPVDGWRFMSRVNRLNVGQSIRRVTTPLYCQCPISSLGNKADHLITYVIEMRHIRLSVANDIIAAADDRCKTDEQREIRAALLSRFGSSEVAK